MGVIDGKCEKGMVHINLRPNNLLYGVYKSRMENLKNTNILYVLAFVLIAQ